MSGSGAAPRVFAVIPTFNRREALGVCLDSLAVQTVPVTVIVADAGSTDGTREALADRPDVTLLPGTPDLWWTGLTNLGLTAVLTQGARGDFVLCLNDDTEVGPDYVERLLGAAGESARRLVGSVAVDAAAPDRIIDGGVSMNWLTAAMTKHNGGRLLAELPAGHLERVNVLPGRGTLIPMAAFLDLGRFSSRLPHYAADYEFANRCARAGYQLVVSYDARLLSRTDLTGLHRPRRVFSLTEAHAYFFTRRSSCNLRDRAVFTWLTRRSPVQALIYFMASLGRITWRYFFRAERNASPA